jgi:hypothetical protein
MIKPNTPNASKEPHPQNQGISSSGPKSHFLVVSFLTFLLGLLMGVFSVLGGAPTRIELAPQFAFMLRSPNCNELTLPAIMILAPSSPL